MAASTMIVLCLLVSWSCLAHCQTDVQMDAADKAMDALTSRFIQLSKQLADLTAAKEESDVTGNDLNSRLGLVYGNGCDDDKFRCGSSFQCVSKLLVCDRSPDCANGADELNCENPIKIGVVYQGGCGVQLCDNKILIDNSFTDNWVFGRVDKKDWFPQREKMPWTFVPSPAATIAYESGYAAGVSEYMPGTGQMLNNYVTDGVARFDICQIKRNGDAVSCQGYRPSLFGIGKPCYTCSYWRK